MKIPEHKNGTFSVERLCHFRCGSCGRWWSIGDPSEEVNTLKKKTWFCPWCGQKQKMKEK